MGHMPKCRFFSRDALPILGSLLVVMLVALPMASEARDPAPSRNAGPSGADAKPRSAGPSQASQSANAAAQSNSSQLREVLGPGDSIRINVFQNPDLTTETRLSQAGSIVFPLIGEIGVGGLTTAEAGTRIAELLKRGNFILNPQVAVSILQVRSRQVHVLGQLSRPGNYILEDAGSRLTDVLTLAGGINASGADTVTVLTNRNGKVERREIDLPSIFHGGDPSNNIQIENGDTIYVERAPVFYIYGEVQRAGAYRLEPNMIVMQALSLGSGLTPRASERGIGIHRRMPNGKFIKLDAKLTDPIQADDIVIVKESLF